MIDGIGNYATNSRTYLPNGLGCVSRLYTHVARKPVAGLKVHVSHPHRNGLVLRVRARAREFITLLFFASFGRVEIDGERSAIEPGGAQAPLEKHM